MNDDEIVEWQNATGLCMGGDPGGVTPQVLEEHQRMASDVITAVGRFLEASGEESFESLRTAFDTYVKKWPEE